MLALSSEPTLITRPGNAAARTGVAGILPPSRRTLLYQTSRLESRNVRGQLVRTAPIASQDVPVTSGRMMVKKAETAADVYSAGGRDWKVTNYSIERAHGPVARQVRETEYGRFPAASPRSAIGSGSATGTVFVSARSRRCLC
jgi:hypothetical protein